ncbi:MAG: hypothetical protein JST11_01090 [Acidobacteria bacterium]|nr:hypothetical protein [Acidobacteriota bacterium]
MRYARDDRSKKVVDAQSIGERARHRPFSCPTCGARVHYKSSIGLSPDPIFAHNPHEGKPDCENYHPWDAGAIGPSATAPQRSRPVAVEDSPEEFGLCLDDAENWTLYLRLPELRASEIGDVSLRSLAGAYVEVDSAGTRGRLSLIELRPGVGSARLQVPPIAGSYRTAPGGSWPAGIPRRRWDAQTRGVNVRGTLHRLRRGEWVRLREGSAVELGEDLRVVADHRNAPPRDCRPAFGKQVSFRNQTWAMWRVKIPETRSPAVEQWLESLAFELDDAAWDVCIASLPVAINSEQVPIFPTRQPIVARFKAPRPGARVDVTLDSSSSRATEAVAAAGAQDTVFAVFSIPWPSSNELRVDYNERSSIAFESDNAEDLWEAKDAAKAVPALEVSIGDTVISAWDEPVEILVPRRSEELPSVVVRPELDDVRVDLSWDGAQGAGSEESVSPEILASRLVALMKLRSSFSVEIDGGGLGKLGFLFRPEAKPSPLKSDDMKRPVSFLAGIVPRGGGDPRPLPAWLYRRACAVDRRMAASAAKGIDARWVGLLTKIVKEVD